MRNVSFILLLSFVFVFNCAIAQELTENQEQRLQKLEETIKQQEQHIQSLQQRLSNLSEESDAQQGINTAAPNVHPSNSAAVSQNSTTYTDKIVDEYLQRPQAHNEGEVEVGWESRGFFVRVPDFEMYLSGWLQFGFAAFENDTPDNNGFFPHGVSLATDVYLFKDFHGRIELNFATPAPAGDGNRFQNGGGFSNLTVWDAYVEYFAMRDGDNPLLAFRVGQTHVPLSIEGQHNPNQGISIWQEPFTAAWGHGRDVGIMAWGVLSDSFQYQFGAFNGEGQNRFNGTDDVLFGTAGRFFFFGRSNNPNSFFHVGFLTGRDNNLHGSNDVNAASLKTPWGRPVFDGVFGTDSTQAWRMAVDVGIRLEMPAGDVGHVRMEGDFMYSQWERDFATGGLPALNGFGAWWGIQYRHNLTPDVEGAGIFPLFKFSYSDIDNRNTDTVAAGANILGQRVFVYTIGLGYAFNTQISTQFNWVIVNLDEKDVYNAGGNAAREGADGSDDLEHGWFWMVTANW
jgi:hypothetical protein